jgi:hypothetical protein
MSTLRLLPVLLASLVLAGCAATPKPVLDDVGYAGFAKAYIAGDYCSWKGWISPDIAAAGNRFLGSTLNGYSFDKHRFDVEVDQVGNSGYKPTQGDCNQMAMAVQKRQQTINIQNQATMDNEQSTASYLESTKMRNTFCNKIGTQILCNSY